SHSPTLFESRSAASTNALSGWPARIYMDILASTPANPRRSNSPPKKSPKRWLMLKRCCGAGGSAVRTERQKGQQEHVTCDHTQRNAQWLAETLASRRPTASPAGAETSWDAVLACCGRAVTMPHGYGPSIGRKSSRRRVP